MAAFEKYSVSVVYLDHSEPELSKKEFYERVLKIHDGLGDAIEHLLQLSIQTDPMWITKDEAEYIRNDIHDFYEEGEGFKRKAEWRIVFKEIQDCSGSKYYIGPGAYKIRKSVLQ